MLPCDGPELNVADRTEPEKDAHYIRNDARLSTLDSSQAIISVVAGPALGGN